MAYARSTIANESRVVTLPAMRERGFLEGVEDIARQYNMPADWLLMVMLGESGLNPRAVPSDGGSAHGLMQWIPSTAYTEIANRTGRTYTREGVLAMTAVQQLAVVRDWMRVLMGAYARGGVQSFWHLYLLNFLPSQATARWNSDFSFASQGNVECLGVKYTLNRWRAFIEFKTCRLRRDFGVTAPAPPSFMQATAAVASTPVSSAPADIARVDSLRATITPLPTLNPVPMPVVATTATPLRQRTGFFSWLSNLFAPRRTMSAFAGDNNSYNPNQDLNQCFILLTFCLSALLLFAVLFKGSQSA
ncbi:transglycosylase SLT domain-containing protein [Rhodoflexus sp.]